MTFDEFKEFTKAALELAGDPSPEAKAAIVLAVVQSKHVLMPSDLKQMEEAMQARPGDLAIRGSNWRQGGGAIPTIG